MDNKFKFGAILGTVFLVKMHLLILVSFFAAGIVFKEYSLILNIVGCLFFGVSAYSHLRATFATLNLDIGEANDPRVLGKELKEPETAREALNIFKNPIMLGFSWRLSRETDFVKKTLNFDFK